MELANKRRNTFITVTIIVTVIMLVLLVSFNFLRIAGSAYIERGYGAPRTLTVDEQGNIYVFTTAIGGNVSQYNKIEKLSSDGHFLAHWGFDGTADGQILVSQRTLPSLALDNQAHLYVVDSGNYRVQKFDTGGKFLAKWGSKGAGDGQFNSPVDIATDTQGNIYVTDVVNCNIQKFSPNGIFLLKWGNKGSGDGQFANPGSIAIDKNNIIYVLDSNNNRIELFDTNGNFLTNWEGKGGSNTGGSITQIADINLVSPTTSTQMGADNKLYLAYGSVYRLDANGKVEKTLDNLVTPKDNMFDDNIIYGGKAIDKQGNVYIAKGYALLEGSGNIDDFQDYSQGYYNPHVQKFDSDGQFLTRFQPNIPPYTGLAWWAWLIAPLIGIAIGGLVTVNRLRPKRRIRFFF